MTRSEAKSFGSGDTTAKAEALQGVIGPYLKEYRRDAQQLRGRTPSTSPASFRTDPNDGPLQRDRWHDVHSVASSHSALRPASSNPTPPSH